MYLQWDWIVERNRTYIVSFSTLSSVEMRQAMIVQELHCTCSVAWWPVDLGMWAILNKVVSIDGPGMAVLFLVLLNHKNDQRGFPFRQPWFVANLRHTGVVHF